MADNTPDSTTPAATTPPPAVAAPTPPTATAPIGGGATGTMLDTDTNGPAATAAPAAPAAPAAGGGATGTMLDTDSGGGSGAAKPATTPAEAAKQFPFPADSTGAPNDSARSISAASGENTSKYAPNIPNPQQPPNSTVPDGTPNAAAPPVQKAGLFNSMAVALAGGKRYRTTINPNTGETQHTEIPLSKKYIGMSIALEALTGALAGYGVKPGPGNLGRAAFAGMQQGEKLTQQKQQQDADQAKQASDDYARMAATTKANFQTHANALKLSQMDHDYNQQFADKAKPILDNLTQVGAIKASNVRASDALSKYHVTTDMAVPDGVVRALDPSRPDGLAVNPDGSEKWEQTYSIIDPTAKIELPEGEGQYLADHLVKGFYTMQDGKPVPMNIPADTKMRASFVVAANGLAQSLQLTEDGINRQLKGIGPNADGAEQQFNVNLKKALATGSLTTEGMQKLSQYSSLPLDQIVGAMEKDKVKPDLIAQVRSILPADAVDQMAKKRVADAAKAKSDAAVQEALAKQHALQPGLDAAANRRAYGTAANRTQAEIDVKKKNGIPIAGTEEPFVGSDPSLATLATPANVGEDGINHTFLNAMAQKNPSRAALITSIIHGQRLESFYGLAKKDGQMLAADVSAADPSFDQSKVQQYNKALIDFGPQGKTGKNLIALNTAMTHGARLFDHSGIMAQVPGFRTLNPHAAGTYDTDALTYATELATANKGGVPDKLEVEHFYNQLTDANPWKARASIEEGQHLLMNKMGEVHSRWQESVPSRFVSPVGFLSPEGAKSFQHVTKEAPPSELVQMSQSNPDRQNTPQGNTTPQATAPKTNAAPVTGPPLTHLTKNSQTGQTVGWDGKQYVDSTTRQPVK